MHTVTAAVFHIATIVLKSYESWNIVIFYVPACPVFAGPVTYDDRNVQPHNIIMAPIGFIPLYDLVFGLI